VDDHRSAAGLPDRRRLFSGFMLKEAVYRAGARLAVHSHEQAVLSIAVSGGTMISLGPSEEWCDADSLLYLPAGSPHSNTYPKAATRLHIEVTPRFWFDAADGRPAPAGGALRHAIADELRRAVLKAFASGDDLCTVELTVGLGDVIGLLAGKKSTRARSMRPDHWLLRLREFLIAHCSDPMSTSALTRVTGRHPVHISREFRQHFGKTISEFVREQRVRRAAQILTADSRPLASIAVECGFYDQSHFTNAFRECVGTTPAAYRAHQKKTGA
jgi:AraC family transcriptional regulator